METKVDARHNTAATVATTAGGSSSKGLGGTAFGLAPVAPGFWTGAAGMADVRPWQSSRESRSQRNAAEPRVLRGDKGSVEVARKVRDGVRIKRHGTEDAQPGAVAAGLGRDGHGGQAPGRLTLADVPRGATRPRATGAAPRHSGPDRIRPCHAVHRYVPVPSRSGSGLTRSPVGDCRWAEGPAGQTAGQWVPLRGVFRVRRYVSMAPRAHGLSQ